MIQRLLAITIVLLFLATTAVAAVLDGQCSIRFFGDSTLHGFEGKALCQPFTMTGDKAGSDVEIIRQPVVTVLVASMDTENKRRDKKMRGMFDSKNFPTIAARFGNLENEKVLSMLASQDNQPGRLEFELEIRDQMQQVVAEIHDLIVTPEIITFTMQFELSLASFQLKPPSVLGFIRVADQVEVAVDVTFRRH